MVLVEDQNSLDIGGGASVDEEFDMNLFHFWDFPMESVGVDDFVGDWDDSKSECLGPIPLETLMAPTIHRSKFEHIDRTHESKQLPSFAANSSNSQILDRMISIDNQELGSFQTQSPVSGLESTGSCSAGIFGPIAGQPRSKLFRQRPRVKPWNVMSPWQIPKSLSHKTSNTKMNKRKSKRSLQPEVEVEIKKDTSQSCVHLLNSSDSVEQQSELILHHAMTKMCSHCKITKTPQWREGPMGPKTLCNACGVRYRSGRLFPEYRPAASPTFVPAIHSNSHKKVLEMRNKPMPQRNSSEEASIF